jgi:hypothetical protein
MSESMDATQGQQTNSSLFETIASFKVKFDAGDSTRNKTLFGNGRMQVKVQVLVSGVDANGNAMHVPADVMDSIELIHYNTGKTLRDGWAASTEQGRFTLEAPTSITVGDVDDTVDSDSVDPQVRTFWVSSEGAGTTQVGARLSLNGVRIVSNGTTLSSIHDSSVTIEAQTPTAYGIEQFRWNHVRRGNEKPGNRIWNSYLGLYPQGQQIKLVDWIVEGVPAGASCDFAGGNKLHKTRTNYMTTILVRPEQSLEIVYLPYDGDSIGYLFPDALGRKIQSYTVMVNDRDGELTVVQATSEYSKQQREEKYGGLLHLSAIDQYGTAHKLAIRTRFENSTMSLERGD